MSATPSLLLLLAALPASPALGAETAAFLDVGVGARGLEKAGLGFDYAASAAGELGNTHRFTLAKRF